MNFFVWHPGRIAAVAVVFFLGFLWMCFINRGQFRFRYLLLLMCAVLWGLFALWETQCVGYNIRPDLILIEPILMGFSVFTVLINTIKLL